MPQLKLNFTTYFFPQIDPPKINDVLFNGLCECLAKHPGEASFMKCPLDTPFIKEVSFIKCGDKSIPTGIDCMGL